MAYGATSLRACYATSGTDVGDGTIRFDGTYLRVGIPDAQVRLAYAASVWWYRNTDAASVWWYRHAMGCGG
eukprot:2102630-Rhodomonas_salina.1